MTFIPAVVATENNVQADISKQTYHHGALKPALIEAAIRILERDGVESLSLRALARETGVTAAAPYSHFKDKSDILADVAELGFQRLSVYMSEKTSHVTGAREKLNMLIESFLVFSAQNPGLFRVMFSQGVDINAHPTLAMSAGKSYALLSSALKTLGHGDEKTGALMLWSMMYGMAELILQGKVAPSMAGAADLKTLAEKIGAGVV